MSFSIQQLQLMFEDKDKSEPHTPMFNGKAGSLDKFDFLISQIEELRLQNIEFQNQIQVHQNELNLKIKNNDVIQTQIKEIEKQIQNEIIENKLLTFNYIKKHEDCFEIKKQIINTNKQQQIVSIPDLNNPNRPSDCSTAPSPGMKVQIKRAYKKGSSVIFSDF
ncbi:unnamed protein product (macronuclear) [Paramecium tetraurelia]|uniref:Uncharacterized protein n=1 Tax=Paramecium tetraurelia TaxID=5888 RepID=A0EBB7_PARTE|nr:uncharacterized protein GSPATT00025318001 [Paramecium tetraurelia]CAK92584.1 unnamed protein product [Paramecium tetraurelia]|eukprot:XP_001459981.1 hypothetical protein (macronuclear) [Paramecium tetraurelia strain d4-2]